MWRCSVASAQYLLFLTNITPHFEATFVIMHLQDNLSSLEGILE